MNHHLRTYLAELLGELEFIQDSPQYHPEENVLVHSLQVFELAYDASSDPELWAAALLHDVGKAISIAEHPKRGAELLAGLLSPRIVWLIEHHLDLLKQPQKTRLALQNQPLLNDLEQLRRWDLRGRQPHQSVVSIEFALNHLLQHTRRITQQTDDVYLSEGTAMSY